MKQMTFVEVFLGDTTGTYILYLVMIVNLALTLVHFFQEFKGFQWRYLGAIAGLRIPDKLGIGSFFVGPLVIICVFGLVGIVRFFGFVPHPVAAACVAALIGSRISDSIYIHIRPSRQGYCPNPALGTIPYYLTEAALLSVLFFPGLLGNYIYAALGFIGGWLLFSGVLPLLRLLRTIGHVDPWQAGEPIPPWVQGNDFEAVRST